MIYLSLVDEFDRVTSGICKLVKDGIAEFDWDGVFAEVYRCVCLFRSSSTLFPAAERYYY